MTMTSHFVNFSVESRSPTRFALVDELYPQRGLELGNVWPAPELEVRL
jgi:hypothetical protein